MSFFKSAKKNKKEEKKTPPRKVKPAVSNEEKKSAFPPATSILKRPFLSEKVRLLNNDNKYAFLVQTSANKPTVKKEIERRYDVKVASLNILNSKGKNKRFRNKIGRQPAFKKAVVTLKPGHKIEIGI